ncbi:UNVERIFIED_CONTAM: hypothetical protein GTU68_040394 [Idotea baltica]|nr:hypothetical protein [Idotea baltica]
MIISAIVAKAKNNIIGKDNDLPWHLPDDLKWFKEKTKGRHVIMGRKSFDSLGRPLPQRVNIVITRANDFFHSGVKVVNSIPDSLRLAQKEGEEEAFILGGGNIYAQTMDLWDRLYLTEVDAEPEGDTYFPEVDFSKYDLVFEEDHPADDKHLYSFTFKIFERKR